MITLLSADFLLRPSEATLWQPALKVVGPCELWGVDYDNFTGAPGELRLTRDGSDESVVLHLMMAPYHAHSKVLLDLMDEDGWAWRAGPGGRVVIPADHNVTFEVKHINADRLGVHAGTSPLDGTHY